MRLPTLLIGTLLVAGAAVHTHGEHPVDKIINLLKELKDQSIAEGKDEALSYEKFAKFCKDSQKTLKKVIAEENDIIDTQQIIIDSKTALKNVLEKQIGQLQKEIGANEADADKADDERTKDNNLYKIVDSNLQDTIDAIKDALTALDSAQKTTDTGLLQVKPRDAHGRTVKQLVQVAFDMAGASVTEVQRAAVDGFLQIRREQDPDEEDTRTVGAVEDNMAEGHVKKYTFKAGSIIEMLKQLQQNFEKQLLEVNKAETNSVNGHELEQAAREDAHTAATTSKEAKDKQLENAKDDLADATTLKGYTEDDKKADEGTLAQNIKDCDVKKMEWGKRSETRNMEIEAMDAAIKIMGKVTGVRTEAPGNPTLPPSPLESEVPGFVQKGHRALSFLQLSNPEKAKAVEFLRDEARKLHSKALEQLAMEVSTHLSDPFKKVNNMIEKMIFRLMQEQKDEDDHKNWCDKELKKTQTSKSAKEDKMEDLQTDIEDGEAKIGKLQDDIRKADDMVVTITEHMAEATKIRKTGKDENALALKDSQDAQKAVDNAIAVLTDFYKESGKIAKESWESFVQKGKKGALHPKPAMLQKAKRNGEPSEIDPDEREPVVLPENPATWETDYSGVADPKNADEGILALLERVGEDFARMEADIKSQEQTDQDNYDQEMSDCTIEKARRSKESEMKTNEAKRQSNKVTALKKKHKAVTAERDATAQYLSDLEPACVKGDSTYGDRKAARAKEIEALHQAEDILANAYKAKGFLQKHAA